MARGPLPAATGIRHPEYTTPRFNLWYNGDMREPTRKPLQMGRSPWSLHRVAAGVSLRQVAAASGINKGMLSLLEQGRYVPSPQEAEAILRAIEKHRVNVL